MAWPYMATDTIKLGVYLKIWKIVDHRSRNEIDTCVRWEAVAKTNSIPIFLSIFRNFLCIYKKCCHFETKAWKLLIYFYFAYICIYTVDWCENQYLSSLNLALRENNLLYITILEIKAVYSYVVGKYPPQNLRKIQRKFWKIQRKNHKIFKFSALKIVF